MKKNQEIAKLLRLALGEKVKENIPLSSYTTFGIGGPARFFYPAASNQEIQEAVYWAREIFSLPYFILGGGSNILVSDQGFPGLVIKIATQKIEVNKEKIIAEAGVPLSLVVNKAKENCLSGLECCVGIPGSLGGAINGNAGAKDSWIGKRVEWVDILDKNGKVKKIEQKNCQFGYRSSRFKKHPEEIILKACLKLKKEKKEIISQQEALFLTKRRGQPKERSAGSVFKNPPGDAAGRLIDLAGLKGKKKGEAQISPQHANFIVNLGRARASDVLYLMRLAQDSVWKKFGVKLEPEIKLVGFNIIKSRNHKITRSRNH